jgi:hypothetical protein
VKNGKVGIFILSEKTGQNTKSDGPVAGQVHQDDSQLRAGLARYSDDCGAADVFSGDVGIGGSMQTVALLEPPEL